jgi:hypothetical protein
MPNDASDCAGTQLAGRAIDPDGGRTARPGTAVRKEMLVKVSRSRCAIGSAVAAAGENAQTPGHT